MKVARETVEGSVELVSLMLILQYLVATYWCTRP